MSTKLLALIPKELHDDLIKEVQDLIKEREEAEKEKLKTQVSPTMKEYLDERKKQREKN